MATRSQLTVQLNNRGVAYLEKGNLHKSFNLFRDSLRNTMAQLRVPSPPPTGAGAPQDLRQQSGSLWMTKGVTAFATAEALQRQLVCAHPDFLFSQGITLMEEAGAYSSDHLVDATVASAIVLFNLALVHHVKGLKESSSRCLIKAQSFYCRSYQLLVDTGVDLGSSGNPVIDLVSMALLNNAAQVGRELCQKQLSQEQFRRLILVATQVNAASYGEGSIATFMEEVKNSFLLNAIVLRDQSLAPAA